MNMTGWWLISVMPTAAVPWRLQLVDVTNRRLGPEYFASSIAVGAFSQTYVEGKSYFMRVYGDLRFTGDVAFLAAVP